VDSSDKTPGTNDSFKKHVCEVQFTGKTNGSGQALIFLDSRSPDLQGTNIYTMVTLSEDSSPVVNALIDGHISYVYQEFVDTGYRELVSFKIHTSAADGSKDTQLKWP
jgi:hypothetical protein